MDVRGYEKILKTKAKTLQKNSLNQTLENELISKSHKRLFEN